MTNMESAQAYLQAGLAVLVFCIVAAIYFAPTIFAYRDKRRNRNAIFILNFLLGWSFIGWVIAFVWASMKDA